MIADASITPVARIEARCEERAWPWAERNRAAIQARWEAARAEQPALFDGSVFLCAEPQIDAGVLRIVCFQTRYSNFYYWRWGGCPDPNVTNCFAMAAMQAADGAFLLGEMSPETAARGQVYFPSGTPDPSDRKPDGTLDYSANVVRELAEETGLRPGDYAVEDRWIVVRERGLIALMRPIKLPGPADVMRSRILERMRGLDEQELSDIRIVRDARDIDARVMPGFIQTFLRWSFGRR